MTELQSLAAKAMITWVIWASLLGSTVIYGFVGLHAMTPPSEPIETDLSLLQNFRVVAVITMALGFLVRFFAISLPALNGRLNLETGFNGYLGAQIVIFALTELTAILGLIVFMTGGASETVFLQFLGAAFIGLVVHAPIQFWSLARPA